MAFVLKRCANLIMWGNVYLEEITNIFFTSSNSSKLNIAENVYNTHTKFYIHLLFFYNKFYSPKK